jgi:hypothetical protein
VPIKIGNLVSHAGAKVIITLVSTVTREIRTCAQFSYRASRPLRSDYLARPAERPGKSRIENLLITELVLRRRFLIIIKQSNQGILAIRHQF